MGAPEIVVAIVVLLLALSVLVNAPSVLLLAAFSWAAVFRARSAGARGPLDGDADLPDVLIQIPTYNEPDVIGRALEAVAALDWPKDRLCVQILDDSTDRTPAAAAAVIERLARDGLRAEVRHRTQRDGFKAGALQHGLAASDAPYVAILDADYVPASGWLRACMGPLCRDERLAFVQSRIDFLNRDSTWFTRGQALLLDVHYVVEQGGRDAVGLVVPFNGTGGVWRRAAIDAVGGWRGETLVEDMDLTYRVEAAGWRGRYLLDVPVPGELPESVRDWLGQQRRWSMGTAQVMRQMWRPLVSRATSGRVKASLLYQLVNVFAAPISILALVAGALHVTYATDPGASAELLFAAALALIVMRTALAPIVALAATRRIGAAAIVLDLPCSVAVVVLNALIGTSAAVRGLLGHQAPFVRTRKTGAVSRD